MVTHLGSAIGHMPETVPWVLFASSQGLPSDWEHQFAI